MDAQPYTDGMDVDRVIVDFRFPHGFNNTIFTAVESINGSAKKGVEIESLLRR